MKTRNDYVSNSSSCSFVVAIENEKLYRFKDFVRDIVKDCSSYSYDEDMSREQIKKLNEFNSRNLNYHLKSSELLFLGELKIKDHTYQVCHPCEKDKNYNSVEEYQHDVYMFNSLKKDISNPNFGKDTGEKIVESTETSIAISYPVYASGISMPSTEMEHFTRHYSFCNQSNETSDDRKFAAKSILDLMNHIDNPDDSELHMFINTSTYFISKNTIWNTRAMLENGAKLTFEKWEDLDDFDKRLDNDQRLFVIRQNHGGNGWSNDAVYALGGWNAKFGEKASVEVLHSECM